MDIYVPAYYRQFRCIADRCRHTCCAGWEIDIDDDTLARYRAMPGPVGQRLRANISDEDTPHFLLGPDERCPFLNDKNLCDLILNCGEDVLCNICRDHPRYRSFWTGRIEIGLGMACEEAARIILSRQEPISPVLLEGDGSAALPEDEQWLWDVRTQLWDSVRDWDAPAARLAEYLIHRHIPDALYDDALEERIEFVNWACDTILGLWQDDNPDTLAEICRRFSADVEYDTDLAEKYIRNPARTWTTEI